MTKISDLALILPAPGPEGLPPPGEPDERIEALLEIIETELMKRGTLAVETLDWKRLRVTAEEVLARLCHVRALHGLVLALCASQDERQLQAALGLMLRFYRHYAETAVPAGKAGARRRNAWMAEALAALEGAIVAVAENADGIQPLTRSCGAELVEVLTARQAEPRGLVAALARVESEAGKRASAPARPAPGAAAPPGTGALATGGGRELDAKGRAELRRDIRALADRISGHDPSAELAFAMRRYAAWLDFGALPPADQDGRIEQAAMPTRIADEHARAAEAPTAQALLALENRLFLSPDWFEGQKLAWRMARDLGLEAVAATVLAAVRKRLAELPGLRGLSYASGAPLVPPEVTDWLARTAARPDPAPGAAPESDGEDGAEAETALLDRLRALEAAATGGSRRARAAMRHQIARALIANGFQAQARMLLQDLEEIFTDPVLSAWDSDFLAFVQADLGAAR